MKSSTFCIPLCCPIETVSTCAQRMRVDFLRQCQVGGVKSGSAVCFLCF